MKREIWLRDTRTYDGPECPTCAGMCECSKAIDAWRGSEKRRLADSEDVLRLLATRASKAFGPRFDELVLRATGGLDLAPRGAPFPLAWALFDARLDGVAPGRAVHPRERMPRAWTVPKLALERARLSCWQVVGEMLGCWWLADPFARGRNQPVPDGVSNPEWKKGDWILARVAKVNERGCLFGVHSILEASAGRTVMKTAWDRAGGARPSAELLLQTWQDAQLTPRNVLPC